MPKLIKTICERNRIEFDRGLFDDWCVYLTRGNQPRYAPRDTEYFARLQQLAATYGAGQLYTDFVAIYEHTSNRVDEDVLVLITQLSGKYSADSEELDIWFTVIYAGMIAEENKAFSKLKKRIKRLGMHQVLMEGLTAEYAANFSRGRKWMELDALMQPKGF